MEYKPIKLFCELYLKHFLWVYTNIGTKQTHSNGARMRITIHSHQNLFTPQLSRYCEEKLSKPVERHHIDSEATRLDVDGENAGDKVEIRVRLGLPHHNPLTVHVQHEDAYAAVDLASDKLERQLRDLTDKRASATRKGKAVSTSPLGEEDFFTEDEEQTLREMGALDAVLEA